MPETLAERVSVVETKVSAHEDTLGEIAIKVDDIHQFVVGERAKHRQRNQFFGGIAGIVAVCGTLWEIFRSR
jgi:hypothetical protein